MALGLSKGLLVGTLMPARLFPEMEKPADCLATMSDRKDVILVLQRFPAGRVFAFGIDCELHCHMRGFGSRNRMVQHLLFSFMGLAPDERLSGRSRCPQPPNR